MKNVKKIIGLGIILSLILSFLVGCGNKKEDNKVQNNEKTENNVIENNAIGSNVIENNDVSVSNKYNLTGKYIGFKGNNLDVIAVNDENLKFTYDGRGIVQFSGVASKIPENDKEATYRFENDGTENAEGSPYSLIQGDVNNKPNSHYRYSTVIDGKTYKLIIYFTSDMNLTILEWEDKKESTYDNCTGMYNLVREANNEDTTNNTTTTKLSSTELTNVQDFLNTMEVNGFIAYNYYDKVEDIDLTNVFYNHMCNDTVKYNDLEKEYLKKLDMEFLPTSFSAITMAEVKEIYKKYTGKDITEEEAKRRLGWEYFEKYDTYCYMHGDTNYTSVKCKEGTKKSDGTYSITLEYDYSDVKATTLTLKKNGDSYVFISNIKK